MGSCKERPGTPERSRIHLVSKSAYTREEVAPDSSSRRTLLSCQGYSSFVMNLGHSNAAGLHAELATETHRRGPEMDKFTDHPERLRAPLHLTSPFE